MKPSVSILPEREPVPATVRKAIPEAWKRDARQRAGGVCAWPGCAVSGPLQYDHELALELGGPHANRNIQALCIPHHKVKTARDMKMIARARRLRGETGQLSRRQKRGGSSIKGGGFQPRPEGHAHAWPSRPFQRKAQP